MVELSLGTANMAPGKSHNGIVYFFLALWGINARAGAGTTAPIGTVSPIGHSPDQLSLHSRMQRHNSASQVLPTALSPPISVDFSG